MDDARPIDGVDQQTDIVAIVAVVGTVFVGLLVYPGVPPALSVTGQIVLLTALVLELFVLSAAPQTGTPIVAGTVTVRNDFVFREPTQYPDLQACLYSGTGRSDLVYGYNKKDGPFVGTTVPAKDTVTAELTILFADNQTDGLPAYLPVELAETCPDDRTEPGIVMARDDDSVRD